MFQKQCGRLPVHTYQQGAIFGLSSLLYNMPRSGTIRCKTAGRLWSLEWKVLMLFASSNRLHKSDVSVNVLSSVPAVSLDVAEMAFEMPHAFT